ncbi:hypothetical protein [Acidovorax sp. FG27]|uniref:hypothetical protein n=1 Tax=Acidovorax sp. FG27 TaxID=3133652 RepID=UPI0030E982C8
MADVLFRATWHNPQQGAANCKGAFLPWAGEQLKAGRRLVVEARLYEDDKTDKQRKYLHGVVLRSIAAQARLNGQAFPLAVWKEHCRREFLGHKTVTTVNPLTGRESRRRQRISTEDLGVRRYSDYIDRVCAWAAAELGVTFPMTFEQWAALPIDPETGEVLGSVCAK